MYEFGEILEFFNSFFKHLIAKLESGETICKEDIEKVQSHLNKEFQDLILQQIKHFNDCLGMVDTND